MRYPSFPFYTNDWLSAPEIMIMTPAEEGAYIRLLAICWQSAGLPTDDDQLAVLSRLGKAWLKSKDRILSCFVEVDGRLQHKRLLEEREKYEQFRDKQRTNGQRGGRPKKAENQTEIKSDEKGLGFSGLPETKPKKSFSLSLSSSLSKESSEGDMPPPSQPQSGGNAPVKKPRKLPAAFTVPSEPEVSLYFATLKTGDWTAERIARQAAKFYNHYSSNGWKVGKNPMKDWKASIRNWIDNDYSKQETATHGPEPTETEQQRQKRLAIEERTRRLSQS